MPSTILPETVIIVDAISMIDTLPGCHQVIIHLTEIGANRVCTPCHHKSVLVPYSSDNLSFKICHDALSEEFFTDMIFSCLPKTAFCLYSYQRTLFCDNGVVRKIPCLWSTHQCLQVTLVLLESCVIGGNLVISLISGFMDTKIVFHFLYFIFSLLDGMAERVVRGTLVNFHNHLVIHAHRWS